MTAATRTIKFTRETTIAHTVRTRQLSGMFDVPVEKKTRLEWAFRLPDLEEMSDWNVGLIVGPSGSGKTTLAGELFGQGFERPLEWSDRSVIDDFDESLTVEEISRICMAVGFNTIPAWMRPHAVLSNGEKFRVDLARRLSEAPAEGILAVDEFSSVVDRQVAKIASNAVQKYARRNDMKFVAVTCHYDVLDWLQPDWVIDVPERSFARRSVQSRPGIEVEVRAVPHKTWGIFAPFHYLTGELHRGARCYALFIDGQPAAFAGMQHRPHPHVKDIMGCSRLVTLPDYQGLGLAFVLIDTLAAAYKAFGKRVNTYPAHPALIRAFDKSPRWELRVRPGTAAISGNTSNLSGDRARKGSRPKGVTVQSEKSGLRYRDGDSWVQGTRSNAVFQWAAGAMKRDAARRLIRYWHSDWV